MNEPCKKKRVRFTGKYYAKRAYTWGLGSIGYEWVVFKEKPKSFECISYEPIYLDVELNEEVLL